MAAAHPNCFKSARLYPQKMHALEEDNIEVHQKLQSAVFGSDLVIEQTLMRSFKLQGFLTRGSVMLEYQRAIWTMSSTVSCAYNLAMQELTANWSWPPPE